MLLPSSFCCQICQNKENMIKSQYLVVDGLKNMTELQELGQYYYSIKTLSQILVQAEINILMVTILTQCRTDSAEPRTLHWRSCRTQSIRWWTRYRSVVTLQCMVCRESWQLCTASRILWSSWWTTWGRRWRRPRTFWSSPEITRTLVKLIWARSLR